MNAANEVLVDRFLNGELGWTEIGSRLEKLMARHQLAEMHSIDDVQAVDKLAREEAAVG